MLLLQLRAWQSSTGTSRDVGEHPAPQHPSGRRVLGAPAAPAQPPLRTRAWARPRVSVAQPPSQTGERRHCLGIHLAVCSFAALTRLLWSLLPMWTRAFAPVPWGPVPIAWLALAPAAACLQTLAVPAWAPSPASPRVCTPRLGQGSAPLLPQPWLRGPRPAWHCQRHADPPHAHPLPPPATPASPARLASLSHCCLCHLCCCCTSFPSHCWLLPHLTCR